MNEFVELLRRQLAADARSLPERAARRVAGYARLDRCCGIPELREVEWRRVPRAVFDFVDGAAGDEVTALRNQTDFARVELEPRVLGAVDDVDLRATVLGQPVALPLLAA